MRNIQQVLECWGGWVDDATGVNWPPIAAGFKGLIASTHSLRPSCCDNDGLIIDACIAKLQTVDKSEEIEVLFMYYALGISKRSIARLIKVPDIEVRSRLQKGESFVQGCLAMLDIKLEMDDEVQKHKKLVRTQKAMVVY
ncbi:antitermination protein Q [Photorhabdus noenieputensis]|uniref:antiterminator Q family protein n=1 Tax=Photorhabdus noenieputensis TaxID=1208607 RepID=UPI001BD5FCE2|nr:antiterminator Q family protein [Photorhabdus noenieputensis]MBS9436912.1 antitermination protein Q [Photorhabdus noenieputensis]MCK3667179.1 antitermination protein Q [Photorhabdus noenieputensis]